MTENNNTNSVIGLEVIGRMRTPFPKANGAPIQPAYADGAKGTVLVAERYAAALADIEGFERLWLIYWLDRKQPPEDAAGRSDRARGIASDFLMSPRAVAHS
jgi:tRNA (Thr-GGU) A37 N-methylase